MDTEKQRQCRRENARLAERRNTRIEQLLLMPTMSLTNGRQPGELLSGLEYQRPGWFLDIKYQTCSITTSLWGCIDKTMDIQVKLHFRLKVVYKMGCIGSTLPLEIHARL